MFDDLLKALTEAPRREVKIQYTANFRLPSFKPGSEHGRDFIVIARCDDRASATAALDAHLALNAIGTVLMRDGRRIHQYTAAGTYMGYYTVTGSETIPTPSEEI